MNIIVLNSDFQKIDIIDEFESSIFTERYSSLGDFEILVSATPINMELLTLNNYIMSDLSDEIYTIRTVRLDTNSEEGNKLLVIGDSITTILSRRIIWGKKSLSGNVYTVINTILNLCIISPTDISRKIPNFIFPEITDEYILSCLIDVQLDCDNVYEIITSICNSYNIGFRLKLIDNIFVFMLYVGVDRSTSLNTVVFSPNFDNLISGKYVLSDSEYCNNALIIGNGTGTSRKYLPLINAQFTGLDRREVLINAEDVATTNEDGVVLTTAAYNKLLLAKGKEAMYSKSISKKFDGQIEQTDMFILNRDFFIGDIILIENEYGISSSSRIIEIVFSENNTGYRMYPTLEVI